MLLQNTTFELLSIHWLLEDVGFTHSLLIVIHCDNPSVIQIAYNDIFHE